MGELSGDNDFEDVLTVSEWYDGPRQGIANFNGEPHFYDCIFSSEEDDYLDAYYLTPIEGSVLNEALEEWRIFRLWELAFHTGKAALESHPSLPGGSERSKELRKHLDEVLKTDAENCVSRIGQFEPIRTPDAPRGVLAPMRVRWTKLP